MLPSPPRRRRLVVGELAAVHPVGEGRRRRRDLARRPVVGDALGAVGPARRAPRGQVLWRSPGGRGATGRWSGRWRACRAPGGACCAGLELAGGGVRAGSPPSRRGSPRPWPRRRGVDRCLDGGAPRAVLLLGGEGVQALLAQGEHEHLRPEHDVGGDVAGLGPGASVRRTGRCRTRRPAGSLLDLVDEREAQVGRGRAPGRGRRRPGREVEDPEGDRPSSPRVRAGLVGGERPPTVGPRSARARPRRCRQPGQSLPATGPETRAFSARSW